MSAKAVIVNSDNKFLVLTNSYWDSNPGPAFAPDLPGGSLEPGETHIDALIREVKEEIGIDISSAPRRQLVQCGLPHVGYTVAVYLVWADIRDICLDTEHCMFSWLTLDEMRALGWWGGYRELFTQLEQHLRNIDPVAFPRYTQAISSAGV